MKSMILALAIFCSFARANSFLTLPEGPVRVLYLNKGQPLNISSFQMLEEPVSLGDFLKFVKANPQWTKSKVKDSLFADASYLRSWKSDSTPGKRLDIPVTEVSWFAARAYCNWRDASLPTVKQWERAAQGPVPQIDITQKILEWYGRPTPNDPPAISSGIRNSYGLIALHGLVWEWTEDFNSVFITGESRGDSALDKNLFCGAGAEGSGDPTDYAAFMRFAYRSSLKADYSVKNLGFRCVKERK